VYLRKKSFAITSGSYQSAHIQASFRLLKFADHNAGLPAPSRLGAKTGVSANRAFFDF
jgi:hypothetical protein